MTNDQLLENLANYGYPLLKPVDKPEEVLTALLEQDDVRLLEGFPVVFLNMLKEQEQSKWEMDGWQAKGLSNKAAARLPYLLAFCALLFKLYKMEANYERRTSNILTRLDKGTEVLNRVTEAFEKSEPVAFDGFELSTERFEKAFQTYVLQSSNDPAVEKKRHAFEQELLLSEIFTAKQKALLKKREEGKRFTKTEREYFSRVVKKRLKALANDELHQLANRLLSRTF